MTLEPADPDRRRRARALEAAGATVEMAGTGPDFLATALSRLGAMGVRSLVLEGGPALHAAAWAAGLVDRVQIFRTPRIIGPGGLEWLGDEVIQAGRLHDVTTVALEDDVMVEGYVHRAG
jgi:riboflavin biosynthesis pyrimidine reductase